MANTFLFRLGFASDLAMIVCYLLTSLVFFKLFSPINKGLSALVVIFAMVGTAIGMLSLLCEYAALHLLSVMPQSACSPQISCRRRRCCCWISKTRDT